MQLLHLPHSTSTIDLYFIYAGPLRLYWTTNFLTNCAYHNIMMLLCFWGADFKNGIKNFLMSMILQLFKIL